jgi:hypothetical protein
MNQISFIIILVTVFLWGNSVFSMEPSWEELHQAAKKFQEEKRYLKSIKVYEELLDLTKKMYGEKNVKVAEVLVEMAILNRYDLGNEKKYDEFQEKAKKIQLTLNGTISCREPKDWTYEKCRERWARQDPCFMFSNVHDYIKVTYYGLDGSQFMKPADFLENLRGLFGKYEAVEAVKLGGRDATRIKLRYEHRYYRDHNGDYPLLIFLYEEFLILPVKKGFLVFNFNLNHLTPLPLNFTKEDAPKDLYGDSYDEYQTWLSFIKSCKINQ